MTCLVCQRATVRDRVDAQRNETLGAFARMGFVNCTDSEHRATFRPFKSICRNFAATDEETAEKRRRFIANLTAAPEINT